MTDSAPLVVIPHARFLEYQVRHRSNAAQSAERSRLQTILLEDPDAPVTNDDATSERFAEAVHILKTAFVTRAVAAPADHVHAALPQPTTGASRT